MTILLMFACCLLQDSNDFKATKKEAATIENQLKALRIPCRECKGPDVISAPTHKSSKDNSRCPSCGGLGTVLEGKVFVAADPNPLSNRPRMSLDPKNEEDYVKRSEQYIRLWIRLHDKIEELRAQAAQKQQKKVLEEYEKSFELHKRFISCQCHTVGLFEKTELAGRVFYGVGTINNVKDGVAELEVTTAEWYDGHGGVVNREKTTILLLVPPTKHWHRGMTVVIVGEIVDSKDRRYKLPGGWDIALPYMIVPNESLSK